MTTAKTKLIKYIRENVRHVLNEFVQNGFSFEKLNSLDYDKRIEYCQQFLGTPIGSGSSRIVFEIDDAQIIKLSYGSKYDAGCAQNKVEFDLSRKINTPILVKTLYNAKDYSWIISERVIPCEQIDFYKILGLPYISYTSESFEEDSYQSKNKDLLGYKDYKTDNITNNDNTISFIQVKQVMKQLIKGNIQSTDFPQEYKIITSHFWFKELYKLATEYDLDLDDIGLGNLGITKRKGKPFIVILDSGLTNEVYEKYY